MTISLGSSISYMWSSTRSVDIHDCEAMYHVTSQQTAFCLFVCIVALRPSQQLWSLLDGQIT